MADNQVGLPEYDHVLFSNAPIELGIAQVKYPPVPRFADDAYMAGIKEALTADYPMFSSEQAMNIVIGPQGVNPVAGGTLYRFSTLNYAWSVVLAADAVSLEARRYTDIAEFTQRFRAILNHVVTHLAPRAQLRFGLRYVNEIRHDRGSDFEGWRTLLNPDLLGASARRIFGGTVEQTINEVRISRSDGTVVLRHGFLKGSTVAPIGGRLPKQGPFYLIDLDYFLEAPSDFEADPSARMVRHNEYLYRVFRWSIGDGELFTRLRGGSNV